MAQLLPLSFLVVLLAQDLKKLNLTLEIIKINNNLTQKT
jgi:hypothetical protein